MNLEAGFGRAIANWTSSRNSQWIWRYRQNDSGTGEGLMGGNKLTVYIARNPYPRLQTTSDMIWKQVGNYGWSSTEATPMNLFRYNMGGNSKGFTAYYKHWDDYYIGAPFPGILY